MGAFNTGGSSALPINYQSTAECKTYAETTPNKQIDPIYNDYRFTRYVAFGSGHPAGANFLFTDGGVRFLADETPILILRALSTRSGGEIVDDAGY